MALSATHSLDHFAQADTGRLLEHEWLLTHGTGGFAMGTALGANTRRYHGLLIAAAKPPVDRVVVLHQVVQELVLTRGDGTTHTLTLGPMLFRGDDGRRVIAPDDTGMLRRFDHGLDSAWSYVYDGLALTRRLVLHDGEPACTLHYDLHGLNTVCERATIRLRPMLTLRGFHDLTARPEVEGQYDVKIDHDTLRVGHGGRVACYRAGGAAVRMDTQWWGGVDYPVERHRGLHDREDYFAPAVFDIPLPGTDDAACWFTAALGPNAVAPQTSVADRCERLRRVTGVLAADREEKDGCRVPDAHLLPRVFARAADDFIVKRRVGEKHLSTVIAGYPWFADWGRDTFIALPGLLLCTGRTDEACNTLAAFAGALRGGLVPNRFDDDDPARAYYNTADASLWFIHSALAYYRQTGDDQSWDNWLAAACREVVGGYCVGTHADPHDGGPPVPIGMGDDGLIAAGNAQSQLTWMDAAAHDPQGQMHVFTPRAGKCVEINALWYSVLVQLSRHLPDRDGAERTRYAALARRVAESFTEVFWNPSRGYLTDHVWRDQDGVWTADTALRPNQMIACALEHSPVRPDHRRRSVEAVKEHLLTPTGLRTLPPDDPEYHAAYGGGPFVRDSAYHRGTVWPWLIGPYAESVLRAGGFSEAAKQEAAQAIAPLLERLTTTEYPGCLGQLHEIHEPQTPHTPRGCPAQAWSVAETLRVWCLIHRSSI